MNINIEKVNIVLVHETPTLWHETDCCFIKEHRIMGTCVGPLPKFHHEKLQFGLPLRLMNVEAKLLVEKGLANIVQFTSPETMTLTEAQKLKYFQHVKKLNAEQNKIAFEERKAEIVKMAPKILEGKRKKLKSSGHVSLGTEITLTIESVINEEISKITNKESNFIEVAMENPLFSEIHLKVTDWGFPATKQEKLQYAVYKDLWEKEYFLSCGIKFGGDYLVYQGDPDSYHASFIVKCIEDEEEMNPCDIIAWVRVGTVTKKTFVLASLDSDDTVNYQSFQWPGDDLKLND